MNVQIVYDFSDKFMNVDCCWPGSVLDGEVLSNSAINMFLCGKDVSAYGTLMSDQEKVLLYLVADPAYPLLPYDMKELNTCDSNKKVVFNIYFQEHATLLNLHVEG